MATNFESGFSTTLALPLAVADTTMTVATAPTVTSGRIKIGIGTIKEWVTFSGVSGTTLTGLTRGLSKTADPATAGTGLAWIAGTKVKIVAMHDQIVDKTASNTYSAGTTQTFPDIAFSGTTTGGLKVKSLTTTQRDALVAPANGMIIYNTTTLVNNQYIGGAWADFATGATPAASTTVAGKVEAPTQTEVEQLATTGATGALVFVTPTTINPSSVTSATMHPLDKLSFSDVSNSNYLKSATMGSIFRAGGDSSDGIVDGTAGITITGSNNTYIVKNYSSWVAGGATRTFTVTPTGCVVHIKIKGNADFTNRTFDFSGKGTAGGTVGLSGTATTQILQLSSTGGVCPGGGGGGGGGAGNGANGTASSGAGGVKGNVYPLTAIAGRRCIEIGCGSGGGAAGPGNIPGTGGAGGGCLIIEVFGDLVLDNSTTVINMNGIAGTAGSGGIARGGGGGGGGSVYIMYTGTLTGTCTPTVAGGTGGAGSGGGAAGGAGGVGLQLIEQNKVFS